MKAIFLFTLFCSITICYSVSFNFLGKADVMITPFDHFTEFELKLFEVSHTGNQGFRYLAYYTIEDGIGKPTYNIFCTLQTVKDLVDYDQYLAFCNNGEDSSNDNGLPYYLRIKLKYNNNINNSNVVPINLAF